MNKTYFMKLLEKFLKDNNIEIPSMNVAGFADMLEEKAARLCEVSTVLGEWITSDRDDMIKVLEKYEGILTEFEGFEEDLIITTSLTEYLNNYRDALVSGGKNTSAPANKVVVKEVTPSVQHVFEPSEEVIFIFNHKDIIKKCDITRQQAMRFLKENKKNIENLVIKEINKEAEVAFPEALELKHNISASNLEMFVMQEDGKIRYGKIVCLPEDGNTGSSDSNNMIVGNLSGRLLVVKDFEKTEEDFKAMFAGGYSKRFVGKSNIEVIGAILSFLCFHPRQGITLAVNKYYDYKKYVAASILLPGEFAIIKYDEEE